MESLQGPSSTYNSEDVHWGRGDSEIASWMLLNEDLFPKGASGSRSPQMFSPASQLTQPPAYSASPLQVGSPQRIQTDESSINIPMKRDAKTFDMSYRDPKTQSNTGGRILMKRETNSSESGVTIDPSEKKKRERLERNREIARNCRRRKREKIEAMEDELDHAKEKIKKLELKIHQLQRMQAQGGESKGKEAKMDVEINMLQATKSAMRKKEFQEVDALLEEYEQVLKQKSDQPGEDIITPAELKKKSKDFEDRLREKLSLLSDYHSDFGKEKENEIKFHMKELERLLVPNQLSKLTLWSLQQEDHFYDESENSKKFGGSIWSTLCREAKVTRDQKAGLMSMRTSIKEQWKNIANCVKILEELDERVKSNFEQLKANMFKIRKIMTPVQQAKLLMWIEKNQPCMYMLNSLWEQERKTTHSDIDTDSTTSIFKQESSNLSAFSELRLRGENSDSEAKESELQGYDANGEEHFFKRDGQEHDEIVLPKEAMEQAFQATQMSNAMKELMRKSN